MIIALRRYLREPADATAARHDRDGIVATSELVSCLEFGDHDLDSKATGIALIVIAVAMLTSAQVLIKSRLAELGAVPFAPTELIRYLGTAFLDGRLWLGGLGLLASSFLWYAAVSRLPLSIAYPIGALSYVLVFAAAVIVLHEPFTWRAALGNVLILAGVALAAGPFG
jgi:drug/metabolite transporter (DMT)-like permease